MVKGDFSVTVTVNSQADLNILVADTNFRLGLRNAIATTMGVDRSVVTIVSVTIADRRRRQLAVKIVAQ